MPEEDKARGDQIREMTSAIAEACAQQRHSRVERDPVSGTSADPQRGRPILIDMDGFFKPMTERGSLTIDEVNACLPLNDAQARRTLTLHQLFRSSLALTHAEAIPGDSLLLQRWSEVAAMFAVVGATNGFAPESPAWLTFYSDDLHRHFVSKLGHIPSSRVHLTLDRRLVALTDIANQEVRISAITREYLLRINMYVANLAEAVVERGVVLDRGDSRRFFFYTLQYVARLHVDLHPSHLPVARPRTAKTFQFAQHITQIQIEFLMSHEFGHLAHADRKDLSRAELEWECDTFAFEHVSAHEPAEWMWFLSVRWLFEILAFDRVVAECLAFDTGDWDSGVDWLQSDLRSRRRFDDLPTDAAAGKRLLSAYENVGSLLLLDLKANLYAMGPDGVKSAMRAAAEQDAMPDGKWTTVRMRGIAQRAFSDGPISTRELLSQWRRS